MIGSRFAAAALGGAFVLAGTAAAFADFDMKAGSIRSNGKAGETCKLACTPYPDGAWKTLVEERMSICGCTGEAR